MGIYRILKDGIEVNRIVADEAFCVEHYSLDGYSYELVEKQAEPEPENGPTEMEQLRADVDFIAAMTGVTL